MSTSKKTSRSGGYFLSKNGGSTRGGVFKDITGPGGVEARFLDRVVYEKASKRAGKMLRTSARGDRAKSLA